MIQVSNVHQNTWDWGSTVDVIANNGEGIVEMSFNNSNPGVCFISNLSVIPSARRQGIATVLLEYCIDYCAKKHIFRIDLDSVKENFVVNMYHKYGFSDIEESDNTIQMYKLLNGI